MVATCSLACVARSRACSLGIDWGTERVMAQTRQRLCELRLRWAELPPLWDLDRPGDLARLATLEGFAAWIR
jgi:glycosyltransferase A (GT-A) superfamily protein (DUF2064 family)